MAVKARERYRVDLIGLQAACEANYARLMRLLPDMRHTPEARRIAVTHGDQMLGVLTLEVIVNCPYTTTLRVRQEHSLPWLPVPQLEVQVYHECANGRSHQRRTCATLSQHLSLPQCVHAPAR